MAETEDANRSLKAFTQLDSIRLLDLRRTRVSDATFNTIGALKNLHWLAVKNCGEKQSARIAKLDNLRNLKVLVADDINGATEFLTKLAKGNQLRRLSLGKCSLYLADLELIAKLPSLTHLNFAYDRFESYTKQERMAMLSLLASKLPSLRNFCPGWLIDVEDVSELSSLAKFKSLKCVSFSEVLPQKSKDYIRSKFPHLVIAAGKGEIDPSSDAFTSFDPEVEDPSVDGLW